MPAPDASAPLVAFDGARIDAGGVSGEPLTACGGSARVALLGNFRPFFRLLAHDAALAAGRVEVAGIPAREALETRTVGLALADLELVPAWTVERYLLESARLLGLGERHAQQEVEVVLAELWLGGWAKQRILHLVASARRLVAVAHALIGAPHALCLEAPFDELDAAGQHELATALERVALGRRLVFSLGALPASGPVRTFTERADHVVVEERGRIVREGAPSVVFSSGSRYLATVTRSGPEFFSALAERGITPTPGSVAELPPPADAPDARPVQGVLELPPGTTTLDVLGAAERVGAPLVELVAL